MTLELLLFKHNFRFSQSSNFSQVIYFRVIRVPKDTIHGYTSNQHSSSNASAPQTDRIFHMISEDSDQTARSDCAESVCYISDFQDNCTQIQSFQTKRKRLTFRGYNSVILIFASLLNRGQLLKEGICSYRSKFLSLRADLIFEGLPQSLCTLPHPLPPPPKKK